MTEDQVTDISYDFAFPIRSQSLVEVIFTRNYYLQYLVTNNHGFDLEITFTVLFVETTTSELICINMNGTRLKTSTK